MSKRQKMITLYKAFPDAYRQSMIFYGAQIEEMIKRHPDNANMNVRHMLPKPLHLKPKWLRYVSQYGFYQLQAGWTQGDINHIVDHAYGHLVHGMNPRKTIVTLHDLIRFKQEEQAGAVRDWNMRGILKAARIVFISNYVRRQFLGMFNYPEERTEVIPVAVDDLFFNETSLDPRADLGLEKDYRYIFHPGHTLDYKNIEALFQTLAILRAKDKHFRLLKVGAAFTDEQELLANKLGVRGHIVHLGLVKRKDLPSIYRASDILLFPSLNEGQGLPVLEAMACGLPVVSSNQGALPEVCGEAAVLADPHDYQSMANHILKVVSDTPLRSGLISAGKIQAETYSMNSLSLKIGQLYRGMLS